jgi:hypothetical protein
MHGALNLMRVKCDFDPADQGDHEQYLDGFASHMRHPCKNFFAVSQHGGTAV